MKKAGFIGLFFACSFLVFAWKQQDGFTKMVNDEISYSVPVIYVNDLINLQKSDSTFLLLDTRSVEEFKVSHIRNATWVGYEHFNRYTVNQKHRDKLVIVYCSIGYRSEKVGEKLKANGFKNVYNLWGGIFDWINKANVVVDMNNNETNAIHPYSNNWGKWLIRGEKRYE